MAGRVTALYLEDTNIKLLVSQGKKVERWVSVPLEPGLVSGGVIQDETKVAEKIRESFTAIKSFKRETTGVRKFSQSIANLFRGKGKIIVGLSGRDSLYRVLSLPVLPDSLLAEATRREAGRVLPVSLNELYLAYQRIPSSPTETRVFVAAFPKKAGDALIKTMRLAGIIPRVLDLAPLALCLSVNEPRSIIADARLDSLNIVVMVDRVPQVIRSLSLQSEEKTISEKMPTIAEEFSRTISFYNSGHQQDPINSEVPVFVSGDLASEPDTWQALVGKLNSKTAVLPCAIQYPEDFPARDFTVNIGLATKELSLDKQPGNYSLVNLNALPESLLPKPINAYRVIVPVAAVAGIAGAVLMWNGLQTEKSNTGLLESQLTTTQSMITSNARSIATLTEQNRLTQAKIQPIKDAASVFIVKLNSLTTARKTTDTDVHQVIALKPATVAVTSMSYDEGVVNVTGSAEKQEDILGYAQVLRDTSGFATVVSSIVYSPTVTNAGEVISSYQFSFAMK